jgi:uroporphyrinogen-III synthase
MTAVWVTRPGSGGARTAAAAASAGYDAFHLPLLEVSTRILETPPPGPPALTVLVSVHAAEGLLRQEKEGLIKLPDRGFRVAAVGERALNRLRSSGIECAVAGVGDSAEDLLIRLRRDPPERGIVWVPMGDREGSAGKVLIPFFEKQGATVVPLLVYETRDRILCAPELSTLARREPGACLVYSPSAGEALRNLSGRDPVRTWWEQAVLVAIGTTTGSRLESLGAKQVETAARPTDEAALEVLRRVFPIKE